MATDPKPTTVGQVNTLQSWGYPNQQSYWQPQWTPQPAVAKDEYANHVEIERGEHDATVRFYRTRGNGKSHVRTVTVPPSVLKALAKESK
jgi:hypothetical protein